MAAHARRISLLLFGLVILTTYSARVEAKDVKIDSLNIPEEKDNGNAGHALTKRGIWGLDNFVNYFNNVSDEDDDDDDADDDGDDDNNTNDEVVSTSFNNSGKGKQTLSGANINIGTGSGDRIPSSNSKNTFNFSGMTISGSNTVTSTGGTCEISFNGIILRGINIGNNGVNINNNKIYLGKKIICDNINKASAGEPTYQKLDDGSLWYTNIKIGKPMTKAEIDKFNADWAVHKKEQEERAAEREREHKQRMEEHRKRMDENNKRLQEEHKQRMAEHNKRMEEHSQRMKQQAEERERRQKELKERLKKQAEERERRQKELMDAMNERLRKQAEEREIRMKRQAEDRERRANRASMNRSSSFW